VQPSIWQAIEQQAHQGLSSQGSFSAANKVWQLRHRGMPGHLLALQPSWAMSGWAHEQHQPRQYREFGEYYPSHSPLGSNQCIEMHQPEIIHVRYWAQHTPVADV